MSGRSWGKIGACASSCFVELSCIGTRRTAWANGTSRSRAANDDLVRIIDESGEDYLFDRTQFAFVDFPQAVRKKLLALQRAS